MKVLVVGDTILDSYIFGDVYRVNPEAPALILDYTKDNEFLGGACNVAVNIRTLTNSDLQIDYFGMASSKIREMLEAFSIQFVGVSCAQEDILTKTRFVAQNHHLLRVDRNKIYKPELCSVANKLIRGIKLENYDIIVISDYNKGIFGAEIAEELFKQNVPVLVDLKKYRTFLLENIDLRNTIFKCNSSEFENNKVEMLLYSSMKNLVVTRGAQGYSIFSSYLSDPSASEKTYGPAKLGGPLIDVVGAGDVFLAAMAAKFLDTKSFDVYEMSEFANRAAAAKLKHFGTTPVYKNEVI